MSPTSPPASPPTTVEATVDAAVVGAGFSGLYAVHRLHDLGLSVRAFEAGGGVGGTWYWNRYPGARCDIESVYYSYSFDRELTAEWQWSERYAAQPEILRYLEHVADRFDLRRHFTFDTRVTGAAFDETTGRWRVETDGGEVVSARHLVLGVGLLSQRALPDIEGIGDFAGEIHHTGAWPHQAVDFTGRRVGVIGTGSTGIQAIPLIARQAEHLTVFQRTPNFSLPARNGSPDPEKSRRRIDEFDAVTEQLRTSSYGILLDPPTRSALEVSAEERRSTYEARWAEGTLTGILQAYNDMVRNQEANDTAADFIRERIREIVADPQVADDLCPRGYAYGTKRPCLDSGYYATYNRDDVELVNLRRTPIERITGDAVVTSDREHPVDALVLATGYDAQTGPLLALDPVGRGGRRLSAHWEQGARSYLGLTVAGFPNLYTICGPGSPSALSNAVVSIEQHVEWTADLIVHLADRGLTTAEATDVAEKEWSAHVQEVASYTLYPQTDSWLMGANIPGKPRVFLPYIGGVGAYRAHCDQVAAEGYAGFELA
ncbi:NAD(P)/FAD-dependent oxidoreductase [Nocardioides sp. YIM 152315]|uniref:flavin-containing monooxygenase n=1 Tax=Nocardioides sp. YIM 152315 TaxID=3031760 RepID=UPI0023DA6AF7|nr:NAD(P)/FAD-dependent oxidoreductase [Nocardioides sp. YIM 152315]MDF1604706.1 NAD(P)/FAD-dependent oxidoreductase [Nocardioides sp. YIM 152315]